jgi:LysR family transcriptional activator of mexEF-oprN operon
VALLPAFTARLREQAPRCGLVLRQADYRTIPRMLDSGEIDTAVASYMEDDLPASAKHRAVRGGRRGGFLVLRDAATPDRWTWTPFAPGRTCW